VFTVSMHSLFLTLLLLHTRDYVGGVQEAEREHNQDSCPKLTKGIFHAVYCHAQPEKLREGTLGEVTTAQRLARHWSACGRW